MIDKYLNYVVQMDEESRAFILRQTKKMPKHYYIPLASICALFFLLKMQPSKMYLLDKFLSSLHVIKSFEN